ncbi:MAG: nicotinate phosphoribosyltransferase [Clostridia bacterium]|nr:nicotinate phosphoribosyltransferase [Clostridia bacterium]
MKQIETLEDVKGLKLESKRNFYSANHEEIMAGATTDIYFVRTMDMLKYIDCENKVVTAEIFARKPGVFAGIDEVMSILDNKDVQVWALNEGDTFESKETLVRIKGKYSEFGIFETVFLGSLASSSGWATASAHCRTACGDKPFICFGARHVHPAVAPVMERAAVIGGADNASCILAAKMMNKEPSGTVPHAAFLIAGDTLKIAKAYDESMPENDPRIILVDTFKDEAEEAIRVAQFLGDKLNGIRLDTPSERGGVTPALIKEIRARLDLIGFENVKIFVSGGLTPDKIAILSESGADAFGVGSYISAAPPIDMTMDIKEVEGKPVAKRGRIPGIVENNKLAKLK